MSDFEGPVKKEMSAAQHRKNNKPLMEKRRRQRINTCLTQLKTLVLEALKKDTSRYSKLEKADILEMTVKHLRTIQRQQMTAAMATDSTVLNKYRAGFGECANEVTRYLGSIDGLDTEVRTRLLGHLANCMQSVNSTQAAQSNNSYPIPQQQQLQQQPQQHQPQQVQPIQVQIPTSTNIATLPGSTMQALPNHYINPALIPGLQTLLTHTGGKLPGAVQLMPAAVPSGGVAFVVPAQFGAQAPHGLVYTNASPMSSPVSAAQAPAVVQCESPMNLKMPSPVQAGSPHQGLVSPPVIQATPTVPKMDANHNIIVPVNADIKSERMWRPW